MKEHEKEKTFMESLKAFTQTTKYATCSTMESDVSSNDGESNSESEVLYSENDNSSISSDDNSSDDEIQDDILACTPLYFVYDCEATGGSVYDDHIVEIAAAVQPLSNPRVDIQAPLDFQSLVKTSKKIKPIGEK